MSAVEGADVAVPDFTASLKHDAAANELHAILSGTADMRVWATLKTYLDRVHAEAGKRKVPRVTVDFRELEFMNSSCFKNFVSWLTVDAALPADQRYKVRFLSSSSRHWQRRSLQALGCVAQDITSVETDT